jgi:hypothetical protein
VEGEEAYLGGSAVCPGFETEEVARLSDRAAEVSRGRSGGVGAASGTLVRKGRNSPCSMTTVTIRTALKPFFSFVLRRFAMTTG